MKDSSMVNLEQGGKEKKGEVNQGREERRLGQGNGREGTNGLHVTKPNRIQQKQCREHEARGEHAPGRQLKCVRRSFAREEAGRRVRAH